MNSLTLLEELGTIEMPAILIIVGALIYFFGQVISDARPYADDRKWHTYGEGIIFFVLYISLPFAIANFLIQAFGGFEFLNGWLGFAIILFIFANFVCWTQFLFARFFDTDHQYSQKMSEFLNRFPQNLRKYIEDYFQKLVRPRTLWLVAFILIYLLFNEYYMGHSYWLLIDLNIVFLCFFYLAHSSSLVSGKKLPVVNVYLKENPIPLLDCALLMNNKDNVRLRSGEKVIILSRDQISRMEFDINKNKQGSKPLG